jgi:hypothetical protein
VSTFATANVVYIYVAVVHLFFCLVALRQVHFIFKWQFIPDEGVEEEIKKNKRFKFALFLALFTPDALKMI